MIPRECKRLAEVDFPIAEVSKHSAREKSIRHGHPSTLHLWWARRPLAACRAMLMALLLPDPCDAHCPPEFRQQARALLSRWGRKPGADDAALRQALLAFIGEFANWDYAASPLHLEVSRGLVRAAHGQEPPLVVDPFAGGGSIPLEALRLGCDAFASDLNPVACLILKVMLEDIPRHGPGLADELRRVGKEIKAAAEKELAEFYPPDPDGTRPIAYLWARTVRCESPNCGAEIPLRRSMWLARHRKRRTALRIATTRRADKPHIEFEIWNPPNVQAVSNGTVVQGKVTCPACSQVVPPSRVRHQLRQEHGGSRVQYDRDGRRLGGARLIAVLTQDVLNGRREYRLPTDSDYRAVWRAQQSLSGISEDRLANESTPRPSTDNNSSAYYNFFPLRLYGVDSWANLHNERQIISLMHLINHTAMIENPMLRHLHALVLGRCVDYWSSQAVWAETGEFVAHTFGRQALPIVWDFAETAPWESTSGNYNGAIDWVSRVVEGLECILQVGQSSMADARRSGLPSDGVDIYFTDPPYYDAIPYSDLSDFFLVWLKRALLDDSFFSRNLEQSIELSAKRNEIIQNMNLLRGVPKEHAADFGIFVKNNEYFESSMSQCFTEADRILKQTGLACIVFAHKTTEGWESLIGGMLQAGFTIVSSWPIATERPGRLRAQNSAALAGSVHLVARPREANVGIGDWRDVISELPRRVGTWMEHLQQNGVRGADLVFACIGPALEIFSRYARVETAEGHEVGLPEYLEKVWEVVGRLALEQVLGTAEAQARNGGAGALEEDARLTALFLWTLQSTAADGAAAENGNEGEDEADEVEDDEEAPRRKTKGYSLPFDVARRFAQPLGIHLPMWEGRIIETSKGVVRLMAVSERARQLFGQDGARAVAARLERSDGHDAQLTLLPEEEQAPRVRARGRRRSVAGAPEAPQARPEATTLDRVHAAMLLQSGGQANALRAMLRAEQDRGPDFLRLANALTALYPRGSEEKRLLDAMLLAVPR